MPYVLVVAGLAVLLIMYMYMRLAKRQEGVQRGVQDLSAANETAIADVRRQADDAQTAVRETAEQMQATLAAQEPVVADVRTRVEGVESRFSQFEDKLAAAAEHARKGEQAATQVEEKTAGTLAALQDEAKSLGAAVQSLRNTSDKRLAEYAARIESVERALGLTKKPEPKKATPPPKRGESEEPAEPSSSVISAMAAPSVVAGQKAAARAARREEAKQATASFDEDEAGGEIDEGSARWIFVVLGLMLALAVIANVASR